VLADLTEADFEKIGIPLGDRKRLLRAINALVAESPQIVTKKEIAEHAQSAPGAERRHLTVMICDLVGSTALTARLDPEDMGAVIDAYHAACARITLSYDGFLADFRGDGILAYFGYPRAHEDDAERTVRAGLDIIAAIARLETRAGEPLSVRIGIATGIVVVGDRGGEGELREHAVVGTRRTSPLGCKHWANQIRLSSPSPLAACLAIFFVCATLVSMRLRALTNPSWHGRSKGCRLPRAVSRQCAPPA